MAELASHVRRVFLLLLLTGLLGCDHATKVAAEHVLGGGRAVTVASGLLELRYTRNDDTAFSLFRTLHVAPSAAWLLVTASLALVGVLVAWFAARRKATALQHAGYAMIVAGALGNVLDRAARGYVVDFIHVTHWPVFNVADIAVVLGVLALVFARRAPPSASPSSVG